MHIRVKRDMDAHVENASADALEEFDRIDISDLLDDLEDERDRHDDDALLALHRYLEERAPAGSFDLSGLDGFLAGLAAGRNIVPMSEWLPLVWNGAEPEFESVEEVDMLLAAIRSRLHQICCNVLEGGHVSILRSGPDGEVLAGGWARGFLKAVRLRADEWTPAFSEKPGLQLLFPILVLAADDGWLEVLSSDTFIRPWPPAPELLVGDGVPWCVECFPEYWRYQSPGARQQPLRR